MARTHRREHGWCWRLARSGGERPWPCRSCTTLKARNGAAITATLCLTSHGFNASSWGLGPVSSDQVVDDRASDGEAGQRDEGEQRDHHLAGGQTQLRQPPPQRQRSRSGSWVCAPLLRPDGRESEASSRQSGTGLTMRSDTSSTGAATAGQRPSGFSSRIPWAASAPALVGLPLRIHSNPTATIAPMIGPTR